jgi:hypothetical protein
VIVVIGSPVGRSTDSGISAAGVSSRIALAAARAGGVVQVVGKIGDDPVADAVALDLARGGVGHVALLRESARPTPLEPAGDEDDGTALRAGPEDDGLPPTGAAQGNSTRDGLALDAADVDLGLRSLTELGVVVVADSVSTDVVAVVSEAVDWAEARLVLVVTAGTPVPDGLPRDVIVFEAPDEDPDGVFAGLVGAFAAALDDGAEPGEAFRASIGSAGWTGVEDD